MLSFNASLNQTASRYGLEEMHIQPSQVCRSKLEIDQDLSSVTKKIKDQWEKHLRLQYAAIPVLKQLVCGAVRAPVTTFCKFAVLAMSGYICYLLLIGIFAGTEVNFDSNFKDVFSKDKGTRLYAGLNLTNGDQAGQFLIDVFFVSYVVFKLFFEKAYHKVASDVINDSYRPYLSCFFDHYNEMRSRIDSEEPAEELSLNLKYCQENMNRLYEHLREDLRLYNAQPQHYVNIVLQAPSVQNQEDPV